MNATTRIALAVLSAMILPACNEETTINNQTPAPPGGPAGPSLPPGALASGSVLILSDRSTLLNMTTGEPATVLFNVTLGGFAAGGEGIVAIDYRPSNGVLYGLSNQGRLYTIDPATGTCAAVSLNPVMAFTGTRFGMDFNPVTDLLRVVTDTEENVRINPNTGTLTATDTSLTPAGTAFALAYTNSFAGASTTTLFLLDMATGNLMRLDNPNNGVLTTVGSYAATLTQGGFDISAGNVALIAGSAVGLPNLRRIDLFTGVSTGVFNIPTNFEVIGLAIIP